VTAPGPVRLLQLTDPHLYADESRELYGVNTAATFRAALARGLAEAPGPLDAILVTGDIAEDGQRATYERFRSMMSGLGVPVMCIPGNHEDLPTLSSVLNEPPLHFCGSASFRDWRIVMLDSHVPGDDAGRLDEEELARLDRELTAAAGQHVLVCLHHQPIPMGSPWLDTVGLQNGDALRSIMARHGNVRAVLWGHVHQASDRHRDGVRMMSTPSTCAQFTPSTQACVMDLRPPGFRRLELLPDGQLRTEVVWLEELRQTERPPDSRRG
jgi:Icc protein